MTYTFRTYQPILTDDQIQAFQKALALSIFDYVFERSSLEAIEESPTNKKSVYQECLSILQKEVDRYIEDTDPVTLAFHQLWFAGKAGRQFGSFFLTYYVNKSIIEINKLSTFPLFQWKERMDAAYEQEEVTILYDLFDWIQRIKYDDQYAADLTLNSLYRLWNRVLPPMVRILYSRLNGSSPSLRQKRGHDELSTV